MRSLADRVREHILRLADIERAGADFHPTATAADPVELLRRCERALAGIIGCGPDGELLEPDAMTGPAAPPRSTT